jgi:hypothetical protein
MSLGVNGIRANVTKPRGILDEGCNIFGGVAQYL